MTRGLGMRGTEERCLGGGVKGAEESDMHRRLAAAPEGGLSSVPGVKRGRRPASSVAVQDDDWPLAVADDCNVLTRRKGGGGGAWSVSTQHSTYNSTHKTAHANHTTPHHTTPHHTTPHHTTAHTHTTPQRTVAAAAAQEELLDGALGVLGHHDGRDVQRLGAARDQLADGVGARVAAHEVDVKGDAARRQRRLEALADEVERVLLLLGGVLMIMMGGLIG